MIYPMRLQPCYKEYLWGGKRLKTEFLKLDAPEITAESWELSCHADGQARVAEGACAGMRIQELGDMDRASFWGKACLSSEFPVLIKLIDASEKLSIQVHPSDQTAQAEKGERGKAEMWYIVDCEPQSYIYFGFSRKISKSVFFDCVKNGEICKMLNQVHVQPGDVFYILPGTIHAIGAGIVIAEIQQSSNTTFRIYDYQRKGADGKSRPLHLERAADVLSYDPIIPEECKANSMACFSEFTMAEMFSCQYFKAYRVDVHSAITLRCDGKSFHHLLCVAGEGRIEYKGKSYYMRRGESYFLPATMGEYRLVGNCRVLMSRV